MASPPAIAHVSAAAGAVSAARPVMIGSDIYRTSKHASGHPLAIPRVSLCIDLCCALG